MFERLKRLAKLWKLSEKDEIEIDDVVFSVSKLIEPKAEVLKPMTEDEMEQHFKDEELGWASFKSKLKAIIK